MLFDNSYQNLPQDFFERINPVPVKDPQLIIFNNDLGRSLGIDQKINKKELANIFSGNEILKGSSPIALAYAGHQFGNFVNQLGDGRAVLLGEVSTPNQERFDMQLKGSGQTRFSRQGDGRSPLGPVIREYVVSEAMNALGIPSTRSLAAVTTGEKVFREVILPGGILTRIAKSHIRVGTFEYFATQKNTENLKTLADYTIKRHFLSLKDVANPYLSLLEIVSERQIELISKWMGVGFIHGVMNTDNTSIVGETIDYGPCAFMDEYNPSTVFSSIDAHGRYAFGNQPLIAQWNMACFANSLLGLIDKDTEKATSKAQKVINNFPNKMSEAVMSVMCKKIGLDSTKTNSQEALTKLLRIMLDNKSDYTLTFRYLSEIIKGKRDSLFKQQFLEHNQISNWLKEWKELIKDQNLAKKEIALSMESSNPVFIPRNHLVERAIEAAVENNDFSEMKTLLTILSKPYEEQSKYGEYMKPPKPLEVVHQTFCGT
ncbi:MAG TPA: YdiU family protein [Gammaproteobacteria bacterium]|nr:YdiU family protein [Gammaproteobacteria bacterium]